jgi:hypothetical protein
MSQLSVRKFCEVMNILDNEVTRGISLNSIIVREQIQWLIKFHDSQEFIEMIEKATKK